MIFQKIKLIKDVIGKTLEPYGFTIQYEDPKGIGFSRKEDHGAVYSGGHCVEIQPENFLKLIHTSILQQTVMSCYVK